MTIFCLFKVKRTINIQCPLVHFCLWFPFFGTRCSLKTNQGQTVLTITNNIWFIKTWPSYYIDIYCNGQIFYESEVRSNVSKTTATLWYIYFYSFSIYREECRTITASAQTHDLSILNVGSCFDLLQCFLTMGKYSSG